MKKINVFVLVFFVFSFSYSQENKLLMDYKSFNDSLVLKKSKCLNNQVLNLSEIKSFEFGKLKSAAANTFGFASIEATNYNFDFLIFTGWFWDSTDEYSSFYVIDQEYKNYSTYGATFSTYVYRTTTSPLSAATIDMSVASSNSPTIYQNKTITTFAGQSAYWNSYSYVSSSLNFSVDTWSFSYLGTTYQYRIFTTVSDWNLNKSIYNIMKGGFTLFPNQNNVYTDTIKIISMDLSTKIVNLDGKNVTIKTYPNPTKEKLTIEASENIKTVEFVDLKGVVTIKVDNINSIKNEVSVSELRKGIYLIRITLNSGIVVQKIEIK